MLLVTFYFRALDQALRWRESGPIGAKCVTGFMIAFILTTRHIRVNKLPFYYRLLFRKRLRVHRSCFGIMEVNKELNYEETGNEIGWVHQLEKYFKITENDGKNVKVLCLQCLPKKVYLSTSKISPANLLKHVEVSFISFMFLLLENSV